MGEPVEHLLGRQVDTLEERSRLATRLFRSLTPTRVAGRLDEFAGRVLFNGFPTGVVVTAAQHHGGPFPAASDPRFTSVGTKAIDRFLRPVTFQNTPQVLLPEELQEANPLNVPRRVDGRLAGS